MHLLISVIGKCSAHTAESNLYQKMERKNVLLATAVEPLVYSLCWEKYFHNYLLSNFKLYGFSPLALAWVEHYLSDRTKGVSSLIAKTLITPEESHREVAWVHL